MNIRLIDVSKEYHAARGSVVAVGGVSLDIKEGELFVLLGPSGCGKSTVLNLIAGLEKPTRGEIRFGDRLVASAEKRAHLTPRERNVAMVFQSYALYPHLTVYENIAFPLRIAGEGKQAIGKSVSQAASMLGIADLFSARPGELSGGQRQRVAIARAIVRQPSIFLLDEPLSNLDALTRASTRAELKKLQRSLGITTVYVTHDQVEAMSLGDRIAVMKAGGIDQAGVPQELYEKPANAFVATFIGSPPMNLIEASLIEDAGTLWLTIGGARLRVPEKARLLKESGQAECLLGIRPENVHIAEEKTVASLPARIIQVEPLGRETFVHARVDDREISFLIPGGHKIETRAGESPQLAFDLAKAHFFAVGGGQESLLYS